MISDVSVVAVVLLRFFVLVVDVVGVLLVVVVVIVAVAVAVVVVVVVVVVIVAVAVFLLFFCFPCEHLLTALGLTVAQLIRLDDVSRSCNRLMSYSCVTESSRSVTRWLCLYWVACLSASACIVLCLGT